MLCLLIVGIAAAASWTVGLALLADTFPAGELGWAMGIVFGFNTFGYFVGPLMGGVLTKYFSLETPFYICSIFAAVDMAGRLFIKPVPVGAAHHASGHNTPDQGHDSATVAPGVNQEVSFMQLCRSPEVFGIGVLMALSAASFGAIETLLAFYLETRYGMDSLAISMVMLAFIIPSVLFSIVAGFWADIFDHWVLMLVGLLVHAPSPLILAFSTNLVLFLCVSGYYAASSAVMTAASMPEMGAIVDRMGSVSYAKIYAVTNIFYAIGMLGGPIFAFFFSGRNSFRNCLISVSLLMIVFCPIFTVIAKRAQSRALATTAHHQRRGSNDLRNQQRILSPKRNVVTSP